MTVKKEILLKTDLASTSIVGEYWSGNGKELEIVNRRFTNYIANDIKQRYPEHQIRVIYTRTSGFENGGVAFVLSAFEGTNDDELIEKRGILYDIVRSQDGKIYRAAREFALSVLGGEDVS